MPKQVYTNTVRVDSVLEGVILHKSVPAAGYGGFIFVQDPNPALRQVLDATSMWGGPSKPYWDDHGVDGWEFTPEAYPTICRLLEKLL